MSGGKTGIRQVDADRNRWLRRLKKSDLLRLAILCDIEIPKQEDCSKDEIVQMLEFECEESDLKKSNLDDFARPATSFDVESTRARLVEDNENETTARTNEWKSENAELKKTLRELEDEANRNKSLRTMFGIIGGAISIFLTIAAIVGLDAKDTIATIEKSMDNVKRLDGEIREKLSVAHTLQGIQESDAVDVNEMLNAISSLTGQQLVVKLNARLDRFRRHHIKAIANELTSEIAHDESILNSLLTLTKKRRSTDPSDIQYLESLASIHAAIHKLTEIDSLAGLDAARDTWRSLDRHVGVLESKLSTERNPIFNRLRATIYTIEAGLAITKYRHPKNDKPVKEKDYLLKICLGKCASAVQENPSATMAYIWSGLAHRLKFSQLAKQGRPIQELEVQIQAARDSYLDAVRQSRSSELRVAALNNLAYLLAKASEIYTNSKQPDKASQILEEANRTIDQAQNRAEAVEPDPIVWATEADIKALRIPLDQNKKSLLEDKAFVEAYAQLKKRLPGVSLPTDGFIRSDTQKFEEIIDLLKMSVDRGFKGYYVYESVEVFLENEKHFKNLKRLDPNYKKRLANALDLPLTTAPPAENVDS